MSQDKTILILAANPKKTNRIRFDEEVRKIGEILKRNGYSKSLEREFAVGYTDIHQSLLDYKPQIVHFIGHGAGQEGLVIENDIGEEEFVDGGTLAELFELFNNHVECVVLNACYSEIQAKEISQHINYVVGMSRKIKDTAAINFAVSFYIAWANGQPLDFAYRLGCNAIRQKKDLPESLKPLLWINGQLLNKPVSKVPEASPEIPQPDRSISENLSSENPKNKPELQTFTFEVVTLGAKGNEISRKPQQAEYFTEDLGNYGVELKWCR